MAIYKQAVLEFQQKFSKEAQFENAQKKEYESFLREPFSLQTRLKIVLPNGYAIEISFSPIAKLSTLFETLDKLLILYNEEYYLIVPPMNQVKHRRKGKRALMTFQELNLVPNGQLDLYYEKQELNNLEVLLTAQTAQSIKR